MGFNSVFKGLIIRLLHLTISEALGCNLVANKHVGHSEVLRQQGRHTEHITHQITYVIRNVHHRTHFVRHKLWLKGVRMQT